MDDRTVYSANLIQCFEYPVKPVTKLAFISIIGDWTVHKLLADGSVQRIDGDWK